MNKILTVIDKDQILQHFQIPPTDVDMILASYHPYVEYLGALDKEFTAFANLKEINEQACKDAKSLRLKYQKIRTGTETKRVEIKETVLLKCKAIDGVANIAKLKAIDGVANIIKLKVTERENLLKEIETHFEHIEKSRIKAYKDWLAKHDLTPTDVTGLGAYYIKRDGSKFELHKHIDSIIIKLK